MCKRTAPGTLPGSTIGMNEDALCEAVHQVFERLGAVEAELDATKAKLKAHKEMATLRECARTKYLMTLKSRYHQLSSALLYGEENWKNKSPFEVLTIRPIDIDLPSRIKLNPLDSIFITRFAVALRLCYIDAIKQYLKKEPRLAAGVSVYDDGKLWTMDELAREPSEKYGTPEKRKELVDLIEKTQAAVGKRAICFKDLKCVT